ncbi:MAG: methyltransferase domain-containing protein [Promethearchaeota archaeon]
MAVVYMRKLEQEPETYDSEFTNLTKGINIEVQDWILDRINTSESILDIGCGTGALAAKIALKGNDVVAIDKNFQMINYAIQNYPQKENLHLLFQIGSFSNLQAKHNSKDIIVSTFMLSELRPFEQQIFLRNAWKALKPQGRLIIAAEFIPSGFWRQIFKIKRWRYKKKLRRLRLKSTFLLKWFFKYLEPIGFTVNAQKEWKHGSIQVMELIKKNSETEEPGYYRPLPKKFKGLRSQFRIYRCIFTGQVDHVPIEPGIYQAGNPDNNSPIIVTANYEYTYIKVMRDLKDIDAWILCVDSNGINVWCAARGNNFGNSQLLEAVEATGIQNYTNKKILLLPQLSAGGVAIPDLPINSKKFPFKVKYGPIWSKYIPNYLTDQPSKKPEKMRLARFAISHRIRAGITHTTFLFRKIFILPILALLMLFLVLYIFTDFHKLWWIGELCIWILLANIIIFILFPLSKFTQKFVKKGFFFGFINIVILGGLTWLLHNSIFYTLINLPFFFWSTFFSTMSFSGYTMATSPRKIEMEYRIFSKLNKIFLLISLVSLPIGIIFY